MQLMPIVYKMSTQQLLNNVEFLTPPESLPLMYAVVHNAPGNPVLLD